MVSNNDITRSATSHLVSTFSDALLANNWAQVRAKHIRYAVALRSDGGPDYNYSVARLTRVATSALHTALLVLNDDPGKLGELSGPLGRAAELMEYLANLPGETGPFYNEGHSISSLSIGRIRSQFDVHCAGVASQPVEKR